MTDISLNKNDFMMTYKDAVKNKYIDMPVTKWIKIKDGGDIPFHRVDYIKYKGKVIWDKFEKICLIDDCIKEKINEYIKESFKLVTLNVMSDMFNKHITNMAKRTESIIKYIQNTDADILCLQEVTDVLYNELIKLKEYKIYVTKMDFNNIVIMSKITCDSYHVLDLGYSADKSALIVNYKLEDENILTIVGIHLTSDYHSESSKKRAEQLYIIKKYIKENSYKNVILIGDTNEKSNNIMHFKEYNDAWLNKYPDDNGYTYDVTNNKMLKKLSIQGFCYRFDRILYTNEILCESILLNTDIDFSDHYSLEGLFKIRYYEEELETLTTNKFTNKTALCIIPSVNVWDTLNSFKKGVTEDTRLGEWMHHINLIWGFIEDEKFYDFYCHWKNFEFEPFEITLNKFDIFKHEKTTTVFLSPDNESFKKIKNIQTIFAKYCNVTHEDFVPHLTIGNFTNEDQVKNILRQRPNIKFTCDKINMISKEENSYYVSKRHINNKLKLNVDVIVAILTDITNCIDATKSHKWEICGSHILNVASESSDIDLLLVGKIYDRSTIFTKLKEYTDRCGIFTKTEIISNKFNMSLKLKTCNNSVDIQYIKQDNISDPFYYASYNLYSEPRYILNTMKSINKISLFEECLRHIKCIFQKNKFYGNTYGFLNGIALATLTGYIIKNNKDIENTTDFISKLKEMFSKTDLSSDKICDPISISDMIKLDTSNYCDNKLYIGTSTTPIRNIIRTSTNSTLKLIQQFINNDFNFKMKAIKKCTFTIFAKDDIQLDDCIQWLNSTIVKMMIIIEKKCDNISILPNSEYIIKYQKEDSFELMAEWSFEIDKDYSYVDVVCDKLIKKSKMIFNDDCYLTYSYCKL